MWGFPGSSEVKNLPASAGDVSSVRSRSCVQLFATPWTTAHQAYLSITNSRSLLKIMSIKLVMPSNHLILCRPLLLLPSIFPSIRVFSNELVLCIRWPKYWSFSFNISLSSYPSDATWFLWDKGSEGFPGGASGKETDCQCRRGKRHGFSPWVGKIPRRRAWQSTPVFLPGESRGQRSLVGYSPWGCKEWTQLKQLSRHAHKGG